MIARFRHTSTILLVLFALLTSVSFSGCETTTDSPQNDNTIRIGALLPLSGSSFRFGASLKAALDVSTEDFNDFLSTANSSLMVEIDSANTESDPAVALQRLDELADRGIKVIIGPATDNEVAALLDRAKERGVILLSPASMISTNSIANDNFFSMVSDHTVMGAANAAHLKSEGITHLIVVRVDDAWGQDVLTTTRAPFEADGGTVVQEIKYVRTTMDPVAIRTQLSAAVASAIATHGAANVGVALFSYREGMNILKEVSKDETLDDVKWLGTPTLENEELLVEDKDLVSFLQRVGFPCPMFAIGPDAQPITQAVQDKLIAKTGEDGDSHALAAYDAVWLAAYTLLDAGSEDAETLRKVLLRVSQTYFGATGWTGMNEDGSRRDANFDFWSVRAGLDGFGMWYRSAVYERQPNGQYIYRKL